MSAPRGTLDRSLFGRAETKLRNFDPFGALDDGDFRACAKQIRTFLSNDDGFIAFVDGQTHELLRRAVRTGMGLDVRSKTEIPTSSHLGLMADRLQNIRKCNAVALVEIARFCGYIASTKPGILRPSTG